ncbi:MAG: hypothetical protein PVH96_08435 [Gemmatimonadota bacterium]|jgi:hypothetical protein
MRHLHRAAVVVLLLALGACGGDDPTSSGLTLDDLTGSWIATSALFTNNANSSETFDLVDTGGEIRFTVLAGGNTRIWIDDGTTSDEFDAVVTLSGSTLTIDPVEAGRDTDVFEITLVNNVLTMTNSDNNFDFTLSGATPVSATLVLTMVPN